MIKRKTFSIRIVGNILNEDVLGRMEFGCGLAGAKIIVVLAKDSQIALSLLER